LRVPHFEWRTDRQAIHGQGRELLELLGNAVVSLYIQQNISKHDD
jgi:hypothetical protein